MSADLLVIALLNNTLIGLPQTEIPGIFKGNKALFYIL
jgi:hypothetical protein